MYDASQGFFFYDDTSEAGRKAIAAWKAQLGKRRRVVDVGAGLAGKADLFRRLAVGLALAEYFGHNWDALDECLRDTEVVGPDGVALIHDALVGFDANDLEIYVGVLATAADHWRAAGRPTLLQSAFPVALEASVRAGIARDQENARVRDAQREVLRQRRLSSKS